MKTRDVDEYHTIGSISVKGGPKVDETWPSCAVPTLDRSPHLVISCDSALKWGYIN